MTDENGRPEVDDVEQGLHPEKGESIFDQYAPEPVIAVRGPDGMPVDKDPPWRFKDAVPPPLTPQTFCCLAQKPDPSKGRLVALPACRHYKRQRYISPHVPDSVMIDRFCTHETQRGLNGACLILKDAAIFDCELRDPPDPASTAILDALDAEKIAMGQERLAVEGLAGVSEGGKSGKLKGYRMFKTPEDIEAGRTEVDEDDFSEVED